MINNVALKKEGFTKLYKVIAKDNIHFGMEYHDGENTDVVSFNDAACKAGCLYFTTVDEIFSFIFYGDYITAVTISNHEEIYVEDGKLKARSICLNGRMPTCDLSTIVKLVSEGADIHVDNDIILFWAAVNGYTDIVEYLLSIGANIHADNDCALRYAALNGKLDVVKLLVNKGADIHVMKGYTLYWSMLYKQFDVANYLVSVGANTSVLTRKQKKKLNL